MIVNHRQKGIKINILFKSNTMTSEELKAKRTLFKLTQQELGVLAGYDVEYARMRIYDYESGRRKMKHSTSKALTTVFEKLESESK